MAQQSLPAPTGVTDLAEDLAVSPGRGTGDGLADVRGSGDVAASTISPLLSARGLNVTYRGARGEFHAVKDIDLEIRAGEQVALVGESGSGKTTLGMAIAGYVGASTGADVVAEKLQFDGELLDRRGVRGMPRRTPGMAMIFQDAMTSLDPVWTIGSQLRAVLAGTGQYTRAQIRDEARSWLTAVGLSETDRVLKSRPYELSGGMRQRAMLAIALSGRPKLLIADEPTSALDASLSRAAMELMRSLAVDTGTALLVVTHDVKLCTEFTDRVMVMYRGELVEQGPSSTLADTATHPYTRGLLRCVPTLESRHAHRLAVLADFAEPMEAIEATAAVARAGDRDVA